MPSIRQLIKRAHQHFPNSKPMQKDWVRKTYWLYQTRRHALLNGGWQNGARP